MNNTPNETTLKPCRKCGSTNISRWHGQGTQAEMDCSDCGLGESLQVSDLLTYEERYGGTANFSMETLSYPEWVVQRAHEELAKEWNTRSTPISNDATVDAVEVAARAIFKEYYPNGYGSAGSYDEAEESHKANLRRNAKAALSAAYPALVKERDALRVILEKLVRLHMSEQEGMECGMPTAQQWLDIIDEAVEVLETTKEGA